MQLKNSQGMTLVEVIVASLVFISAIIALAGAIVSCVDLIDISRERDIAVTDLKNMMEKIRATAFNSITARFPDGVADGPVANPYSAILGGYSLANEAITVSYTDANADPLEILATVMWQDKKGRSYHAAMSTFRTR